MGKDVAQAVFTHEDRVRYREKVHRCLEVFGWMLTEFGFDANRPTTGFEVELNLVDADAQPVMRNAEVLADLADARFQTELGRFNLELNARPRLIAGTGFRDYEEDLRTSLAHAEERSLGTGASIVLIGILPTLTAHHLVAENLSNIGRYQVLNDEIVRVRGENLDLDISGVERLHTHADSIAPEAACTSLQIHLQVSPEQFATYWNAAQAIAAAQVAVGANSPFLYGKRLWAETRIALFQQATDTRSGELKAQGVRPRVWFGERWINSIFELFEENLRYFPPLLPICDDEDPVEVFRAGGIPSLAELRLHNSTVYRWNRPVYDVMAGRPHLRVENRVLPAGPTVVDMLANAAFYLGLVRELSESDTPVWTEMTFRAAEDNFHAAARHGMAATVYWPRLGQVRVTDLVREVLLPMAHRGLDRFGVVPAERDRLLGIIEERCRTGRNGAVWQTEAVQAVQHRRGLSRPAALRDMLLRYCALQRTNTPVHTWPVLDT